MKKIKVFILLALALAAVSCSEEDLDSKAFLIRLLRNAMLLKHGF